jgi:hypothetical protein
MVLPMLTWPSPAMATLPLRRTETMVVPRNCSMIFDPLEMDQAGARQGKNGRESAVYTAVHEHFETVLNAVSRRLICFV